MNSTTRKAQRLRRSDPPAARSAPAARVRRFDLHDAALAGVVLLVGIIRLRLLAVPFERDEGEYAYMGQLLLHGGLPYRDAYSMKLPGTYAAYSLIMAVFGSSPTGVHAGFLIVSLTTIVLMYVAFRRLFTPTIGLVAATVYGLLSVGSPMLGPSAHATHFVNLFAVLGLVFYARWNERRPWRHGALTGLMFGLAILMKQPAVFLALFGGIMVLVRTGTASPRSWKSIAAATLAYCAGVAAPYALVVLVMAAGGALDRFWFWTVTYATTYASADTPWDVASALFGLSFGRIFGEYPLVWLLALAGLPVAWIAGYDLRQKLLVTVLGACSVASVLPGFNFREHYFVLLLPAVGVQAAIALAWLADRVPRARSRPVVRALPFAAVAAMGVFAIATGRAYYVDDSPDEVCRTMYAGNPFVEARQIGARIAGDTAAADTVAILGSEPEILVYAGRRSATGYLYVYPLVEPQPENARMQHEMMAEIETARPKYLVYCNVPTSWAASPGSPTDILQWFNRYGPAHYDIVGIVEVGSAAAPPAYYWDAAALKRAPGPNSVWVLRRKGA
jgi:Dolichyl-phosphate-mannose-protein mannosyltransferase